jgi:4a-hydroxytetrahydrobiopterin dehydratase
MPPEPLAESAIAQALRDLPGWSVIHGKLQKDFRFKDFQAAFGWMTRVAVLAEAANHHPDWQNCYNRVAVQLSTHDAGDRITQSDVDLARRIEALPA